MNCTTGRPSADQGSDVRDQMSGIRCQGSEKLAAQSAVEGGKTPRPNISAPAKAGGNFFCFLSPDI
ncbi:MAG: hypothetical protein LBI62_03490 [Candidatus Accumulibacter sp.]|nr:hypothetical protein [Accumulibacter sp.]